MKFTKCSVPVTITLCEHPMTDGRTYINSPDLKGFRYVVEDNSDLAEMVTALTYFVDLKLRLGASVGRNAERQDHEDGLGPKDEHAVGSVADETPDV